MKASEIRTEIEEAIRSGDSDRARRRLADFWRATGGAADASFVVSCFEKLLPAEALVSYRLVILRSFTVEPLVPLLRAEAFCQGINLSVRLSEFNAYAQELLDPESALYRFKPDGVILAVQTEDIAPDLWHRFADLTPDESRAAVERVKREFRDWIHSFREKTGASLIVHSLAVPPCPSLGVLDSQTETGQVSTVREINAALGDLRKEYRGIYILDYDSLVARHGRLPWRDQRKWEAVRMPIAAPHLRHMTQEWMRFLCPLTGRIAKALALDLDNTLWGGIIGEDGAEGIQLGAGSRGLAFVEVQRAILNLHRRGILLAVCSKNNQEDALDVLANHPSMLLRPQFFSAMRINWQDKAQNLREIASELNIGIDALAFLDDNPVERDQVRIELPEVKVLEFLNDPLEQAAALRECPIFERLTLSTEDQMRGAYYSARREAEELSRRSATREDFYRSLQQEVEILPVGKATLARVAQLTQKTNQFNLTTHRYTEEQILGMLAKPDWAVHAMRVTDRYGDQGIVGVAITRDDAGSCEIDTFLMSCRVIDRTLETAFLSYVADVARRRNMRELKGWFLPTKKNPPAKDFYQNHGFILSTEDSNGTLWTLDLSRAEISCPDWVSLIVPAEAGR